ncbi:hypothetical protein [Streptomyces sp. WAC04114]|uniref:hypothetical protein n=1 Tax=Streptomyces sp. WAC04114 TaxID=2867961 RepID=UPI001C8B3CBD|nr:hypothetical protein [Streptomyces sp. WAC04114]MBX9363562.1 hypothetical protein [Streptomyces sp. WAC04114]
MGQNRMLMLPDSSVGPAAAGPAASAGAVDGHVDPRLRREHGAQRPDEREADEAPAQGEEEEGRGRSI